MLQFMFGFERNWENCTNIDVQVHGLVRVAINLLRMFAAIPYAKHPAAPPPHPAPPPAPPPPSSSSSFSSPSPYYGRRLCCIAPVTALGHARRWGSVTTARAARSIEPVQLAVDGLSVRQRLTLFAHRPPNHTRAACGCLLRARSWRGKRI